jgi:carboxyl-terminal processing protease
MAVEPHTNYLGRGAAENFEISMKLSLVGVGAVLAEKDDFTMIRDLVPGGPASLSGHLKAGDRIVGVGQSADGPITDIQGWRLDDAVALIRGAADSVVLLDVLPVEAGPDGRHKTVLLTRKKITLEEQSAKKSVLSVTDGREIHHIGVISLPAFYQDFEAQQKGDRNFKSATRDVTRLLGELKQEKVDGVLIDLRNNGGGSLKEAIELTGLFIRSGPVVQQRDARGKITVWNDEHVEIAWDGPLGVLINRRSASASEIFAAAIQDYGRGLVIGETSFGKGTVQSMVNLDEIAKNDKPRFGELKLTIAQFFRINGGTTQLRGVTPDIGLPGIADVEDLGEAAFDNALPWMQIKPADYSSSSEIKDFLPVLLTRHEIRVKNDQDFLCLQGDLAEIKLQRKKNQVSLNEAARRKERDAQEVRRTSCNAPREAGVRGQGRLADQNDKPAGNKEVRDDGLQPDERNLANELAAEKARKNAKDVVLNEAVHVVSDEVNLLKPRAKFAVSVEPGSR